MSKTPRAEASDSRRSSTPPSKKLIYILGAGRSGTTLLEILLANEPTTFGIGELNRYCRYKGVPHSQEEGSKVYAFWQQVTQNRDIRAVDFEHLSAVTQRLEYHTYPLTKFRVSSAEQAQYQAFNLDLYRAIFSSCQDAEIVIESSKYPGRLRQLRQMLSTEDLAVIYLKRNPISVVRAFRKQGLEQPPKGWLASALYYFVVNLLCSVTYHGMQKQHQVVQIRYEALTNNPLATLENIEQAVGLNLTRAKSLVQDGGEFRPSPMFDGNRIRLKPKLRLKRSEPVRAKSVLDWITRAVNLPFYR